MKNYTVDINNNIMPPFKELKGEYTFTYIDYSIQYFKDRKLHNEIGAADIGIDGVKRYFLNDYFIGSNDLYYKAKGLTGTFAYIPSDEYWIKYQKLKIFI